MAGFTTHSVYFDDHGNQWTIRQPVWAANLNSALGATGQPSPPKGLKPRRRFLSAAGREVGIIVNDTVVSPLWTDPVGTSETLYIGALGSPGEVFATSGWTGEKLKNI